MPAASSDPKPTVTQVERKVKSLRHEAEVATEKYNEKKEERASLSVRVKAAQIRLKRQEKQVARARQHLGMLAAETYRRGELSSLDYMLSDEPDAVLAQAGLLPSLGSRQAGAIQRLQEEERALALTKAQLTQQQRELAATEAQLRGHRATVLDRLAQAQRQLDQLKAAERRRVQQNLSASNGDAGPGGSVTCRSVAVDAPTERVKKVLTFACAQLGEPYVWGGDGPGSWDCSGFTMMSWRQAGVSLPHSSSMQATYGQRVSISQLRPGDLVFFYSPISHVGISLGGNKMIHAPSSGDVVKVVDLYRTPVAAVRL